MPETPEVVVEPTKPTRMQRIKANAATAGIIMIPIALTGASLYAGVKVTKMQLDTAKLNLETAKLNKLP
jgi:hypothetical protein